MEMKSNYSTQMFGEIFPTLADWQAYMSDFSILTGVITATSQNILYYLLSARYGNDPICNLSIDQFYNKMASIIFQFGPTWEKRLAIQSSLRSLTEDDLILGAKLIFNEAYNPNTTPSTDSTEELTFINAQKVNKSRRNKITAYQELWDSLRSDVSEAFIREFRKCFSPFTISVCPVVYITDDEEEEA